MFLVFLCLLLSTHLIKIKIFAYTVVVLMIKKDENMVYGIVHIFVP